MRDEELNYLKDRLLKISALFNRYYRNKKISWHDHLYSIFSKLRVPALTYVINAFLFKNLLVWEPEVVKLLKKTNGRLFIDIGACYGIYAILLGKKYKEIVAIEPDSQNMQIIRFNVKYARLTNVKLLQCAVSNKDGYSNLYMAAYPNRHSITREKQGKGVRVKTLTLASILQDRYADLVKVDVEGAEWLVLKGAEPVTDKIHRWVVELHNLQRKKELEEWFVSRGYTVKWIQFSGKGTYYFPHIYAYRGDGF